MSEWKCSKEKIKRKVDKMLSKIIGFIIMIFGVMMIFNFCNILFISTQNAVMYIFILKSSLELVSGVFLLMSGIEILKGNKRSQMFFTVFPRKNL